LSYIHLNSYYTKNKWILLQNPLIIMLG